METEVVAKYKNPLFKLACKQTCINVKWAELGDFCKPFT